MEVDAPGVDGTWEAACAALERGELGRSVAVERAPGRAGFVISVHTDDFSDTEDVARVLLAMESCGTARASKYTSEWMALAPARKRRREADADASSMAQYTRDEIVRG